MPIREIKRLLIVSDAAAPQVNGVVRTIENSIRYLKTIDISVELLTPERFKSLPCPSYPDIRLSLTTSKRIASIIREINPDAMHIATEGPLGWAARRAALKNGWQFTSAYHTRFPEYVHARIGIPTSWIYKLLRRFHSASSGVLAPTPTIKKTLLENGFRNVIQWTHGVDHSIFYPRGNQKSINLQDPVFLYVGRLAIEKNIEAFLKLDLPGQKWVAGEGPLQLELLHKYPSVRYIGVLSQDALAELYSQADVFVFPSLTDTFGLVMVEAMACGLPVAAFPVPGPLDVIGDSQGGVLDDNLHRACIKALRLGRHKPLQHARTFSWGTATQRMADALVWLKNPSPDEIFDQVSERLDSRSARSLYSSETATKTS